MPLLKRREFLLTSSAAAGAVVFSGCVPPQREMEAESRVLLAEDLLSAYDTWYATACRGCSAGCGVVVRVVDGRARKVEGNPDHPLNRGKLCARGQALVQEQYHPDRLRGPLQREVAQRGTGAFQPIAWETGMEMLSKRLAELRAQNRSGDVSLITPPLAAHQAFVVQRFADAYGCKWLPFEPISEAPLREAVRRVFGLDQLPRFDLEHARTVLSFGADFLGPWLSPVRYGVEYGNFRQGSYDVRAFQPHADPQTRGRLIHVDTHFSTTAASADEWVWVRPGAEGQLALSLAHALGASGLDAYTADATAAVTGVTAERVGRLARELMDQRPTLVIAGGTAGAYTHGTEVLSAILGLNVLLGSVGQPGGVLPPAPPPLPGLPQTSAARPIADWQDLVVRMRDGREQAVLFVGGANPVHGLPGSLGFAEALRQLPFVASFGSFADDSTQLADLVLPSSLPLEEWGDAMPQPGVDAAVLTMQQPVLQALFDTRGEWDVLLALSDELGDPVRSALPWPTFKDLLQERLAPLGSWNVLLQHGGFWQASAPESAMSGGVAPSGNLGQPEFAGDLAEFPFVLVPFPHNTLGTGESAHLPWMQAAPDPTTSVTWQTWVELNPRVANELGIAEGDMLRVESPVGRIEAPAYLSPAAPPEVIGMPLGQGHAGFGRWATGRGVNPLNVLAPLADHATGALAYGSTRVRVSKTGRRVPLPKLEGIAPVQQLPGHEVIEVMRA